MVSTPSGRRPTERRQRISSSVSARIGSVSRKTLETNVDVKIELDGFGNHNIQTGNPMFDHLLSQLAKHGLLDMVVKASDDGIPDAHHLCEDVAITIGRALKQAVGEGAGIRRMGSALVPLDETLAQVAVDLGGRGYAVVETGLEGTRVGDLPGELIQHFLERLAIEGALNLHARVLSGADPHHKAEALFKALARALRDALVIDPRTSGKVPSTKGTISG